MQTDPCNDTNARAPASTRVRTRAGARSGKRQRQAIPYNAVRPRLRRQRERSQVPNLGFADGGVMPLHRGSAAAGAQGDAGLAKASACVGP
jgi:hypothetical protein